jgi:hypothetical protein
MPKLRKLCDSRDHKDGFTIIELLIVMLNFYSHLHFYAKVISLTIYIALVNSYALFIVYPALKSGDTVTMIISLVIYVLVTMPLLLYIKKRFQPRPKNKVIVVALAVMIGVTIMQYFVLHITLPVLLIHFIFYLFAGMVEETLWRGKLWQLISQKVTSRVTVLVLVTIHFAALHIPFALLEKPVPLFFIAQVLGLGILLGILRIVTNKVTIPAFAHAAINMVVYT